jgi:hypothetical protein
MLLLCARGAAHLPTEGEVLTPSRRAASPAKRCGAANAPRFCAVPHTLTARRSTPARSALVSLASSAPRTTTVRSTSQPATWRTGTVCARPPQHSAQTTRTSR